MAREHPCQSCRHRRGEGDDATCFRLDGAQLEPALRSCQGSLYEAARTEAEVRAAVDDADELFPGRSIETLHGIAARTLGVEVEYVSHLMATE